MIELDQSLHGYENGHQLLSCSTSLSHSTAKLLLLQSDLSGQTILRGFENYLTGYPIGDMAAYAFARTWYAEEMKRPGCVWTHTLIIPYSDLAKLPDLESLLLYFIRPSSDNFDYYSRKCLVQPIESPEDANLFPDFKKVAYAVYDNPDKTILLGASNALQFERSVVHLWSRQWPRLRRNFSFCTGALGLRVMGEKEFDLQVIPNQSASYILRESKNPLYVNESVSFNDNWQDIPEQLPNAILTEFLWAAGAEIDGHRSNYKVLFKIIGCFSKKRIDLEDLHKIIKHAFPEKKDAKQLKKTVFLDYQKLIFERTAGEEDELDVLKFLILTDDLEYLEIQDFNIEKRLVNLFIENAINFNNLFYLWQNKPEGNRIDKAIWRFIPLSVDQVLSLISKFPEMHELFEDRIRELAKEERFWTLDFEVQQKLFPTLFLEDNKGAFPIYVDFLLRENNPLIEDVIKLWKQDALILILNWVNSTPQFNLANRIRKRIFAENPKAVVNWCNENISTMNPHFFDIVLDELDPAYIFDIRFTEEALFSLYLELKKNSFKVDKIYLACVFYSFVIENKPRALGSQFGVLFRDLFSFAARSSINYSNWRLIKKETTLNDQRTASRKFSDLWDDPYYVAHWDYCEILIRTTATNFIKNHWPAETFVNTFNFEDTFERALNYIDLYKTGRDYLQILKIQMQMNLLNTNSRQKESLLKKAR